MAIDPNGQAGAVMAEATCDGLASLLRISRPEAAVLAESGHDNVSARLRRALFAERLRGERGDWIYDPSRHRALIAALRRLCLVPEAAGNPHFNPQHPSSVQSGAADRIHQSLPGAGIRSGGRNTIKQTAGPFN